MIPYIVAGVVALVLLVLAYRSFGGAASRPPDPIALMRLALDGGETAAAALAEAVAGGTVVTTGTSVAASADSLRATRRLLDGCGQQLQQLDPVTLAEPALGAHVLLTVAVDELGWALRLLQTPGYAGGAGMQAAVADLRSHAGSCLSEARGLLPPSGVAKEIGGAL